MRHDTLPIAFKGRLNITKKHSFWVGERPPMRGSDQSLFVFKAATYLLEGF